jgi:2,3-bisphosphoglycerate-dependent phosphoglycerate mutase
VAKDHIDQPYPRGESYRDVVARMRRFLDDLFLRWDERRVIVIGHAATRWSLQHLVERESSRKSSAHPSERQEGWEYPVDRRG